MRNRVGGGGLASSNDAEGTANFSVLYGKWANDLDNLLARENLFPLKSLINLLEPKRPRQ